MQGQSYWSEDIDTVLKESGARREGLTSAEAAARLAQYGPNSLRAKKRPTALLEFLGQLKSPIVILLMAAALLSWVLGDRTDAAIILGIVLASAVLSFCQEHGAGDAVEKLLQLVQTQSVVLRDGQQQTVPVEGVVPGDVALLSAGSIIPGDGLILLCQNLFMDEAALTGETFPVEKQPGVVAAEAGLSQRTNSAFSGTHVVSGSGQMLVVATGGDTEFGEIAKRLRTRPPETEFEHGVRKFGYLLIELTLVLTLGVFAANVLRHKPVLDSFLFALALAVGLTPQLLPAIISVNLARGAQEMAKVHVIVKRLTAIENFGSMDVLCSDKTGTLTEGVVTVHGACDPRGGDAPEVLRLARLNAAFQTGFNNPIDGALLRDKPEDLTAGTSVLGEVPYDFVRKRLSVLVQDGQGVTLITKGALEPVLAVCTQAEVDGQPHPLTEARDALMQQFAQYSQQGLRVLGVAKRVFPSAPAPMDASLEAEMVFVGFLVLEDPLRPDIVQTVQELHDLGVSLKMITGDNRLVAAYVGEKVGLSITRVVTGQELRQTSDDALHRLVTDADVFAEIEPNQKERLIIAFRRAGYVVGYAGDGVNDGAALHAADVGISVANAVDVAKEAAEMVLLEPGLNVIVGGVREGRRTFANTLKYVYMASSANFGNMFSMAGASLFLPFLPLLPKQILLMNLLTDLPEMAIATDLVDPEQVQGPRRWDVASLRRFMLIFGPVSSVFDYMTFAVLIWLLRAPMQMFQTAWFVESVVSAALIVLVIRTRRPFFASKPGKALACLTALVIVATFLLPYTPVAPIMGMVPISGKLVGVIIVIVALYVLAAELAKRGYYAHEARHAAEKH